MTTHDANGYCACGPIVSGPQPTTTERAELKARYLTRAGWVLAVLVGVVWVCAVLMSIIDALLQAVQTLFGATEEIGVSAVYTRSEYAIAADKQYPFILAQSSDRGNAAAALSVRNLLEWYSPEVVVVVGIGGGIQRGGSGPGLGDVARDIVKICG